MYLGERIKIFFLAIILWDMVGNIEIAVVAHMDVVWYSISVKESQDTRLVAQGWFHMAYRRPLLCLTTSYPILVTFLVCLITCFNKCDHVNVSYRISVKNAQGYFAHYCLIILCSSQAHHCSRTYNDTPLEEIIMI